MFNAWNDFFVAVAGAAAALAGLLFVAISINLNRILELPTLPARAFEGLAILMMPLLVALLGLIPSQTPLAWGLELILTGFTWWAFLTFVLVRHWKIKHDGRLPRIVLNQVPALPLVVAGALIWRGEPSGPYWIVPAIVLAFLSGVVGAWVMLIEIQR